MLVTDTTEDTVTQLHITDQFGVTRGDMEIAFCQHHIHIREQSIEKWPARIHFAQELKTGRAAAQNEGVDRGAEAKPARQHDPRQRPTEYPWDCAQIFDPLG